MLKNSIFEFVEKNFKQVRGTTIGIKFAPPYAILFMADLEEKIPNVFEKKPDMVEVEKYLKKFLNKLNSFYPSIKFTAEYSKE